MSKKIIGIIGLAAMRQNQKLADKAIAKAQKAGQKLAS